MGTVSAASQVSNVHERDGKISCAPAKSIYISMTQQLGVGSMDVMAVESHGVK